MLGLSFGVTREQNVAGLLVTTLCLYVKYNSAQMDCQTRIIHFRM